ncbi:hypothetical protein Tco_0540420 [Tanacetum coccineum]
MFTQEEQYTKLLKPITEPHQVQQNDSNIISTAYSVEHNRGTVEQHPATVEETRAYFESLYNNLVIEVKKVNSVNHKMKETNVDLTTELARYKNQEKCFEINQEKYDKLERCYQKSVYQEKCLSKKINALHLISAKTITTLNEEIANLNNQLSKEKSTISYLQQEKKKLKSDFKIRKDELIDKQIQLEQKIKELDNILVKIEADESLAKHKSLEYEIERLLRAVVSQDIMSIVQSNSVVDISNLQTELDRTKEKLETCIIKKEKEYVGGCETVKGFAAVGLIDLDLLIKVTKVEGNDGVEVSCVRWILWKDYLCVQIIMVNVIPPDHVDDVPVFEPNEHDDVPIVPEPVLVDEDEDPEEDEFKEEEDPQEEEDDMEVDIEEDENEPELTYPYEEVDPLNPPPPVFESEPNDKIEVEDAVESEDETVPASVYEVGESSTAPFLHEDSDGLLPGLMRRDINSLFVRSSLEQGTAVMEKLVQKLGNAEDKVECKKLKKELEEVRFSNTFLRMQNERVERDLYWTRDEFYQEMIRRGFVFKERPNEAINVPIEDKKSLLSELRGCPHNSY